MTIRTKTVDYKMTSDISSYLDTKVTAITKLAGDGARVEVELGRDAGKPRHGKNIFFTEFCVVRPGEPRVCSRNNGESINESIDDAKDEMVRQLKKLKTKGKSTARKEGRKVKRALRDS